MGYFYHRKDNGYARKVSYDGHVVRVTLTNDLFGISVRATAKCSPEDTFDLSVGLALGTLRAEQKLAHKLEREIAKNPKNGPIVKALFSRLRGSFNVATDG